MEVDTVDIDSVFIDGVLTNDRTSELCHRSKSVTSEERDGGKRGERGEDHYCGANKMATTMTYYGALLTSQPQNSFMSRERDVLATGLNFGATHCSSFADEKQNFKDFSNNQPPTSSVNSVSKM